MPLAARELPPATQRFDTVDLLRGLSILAVVLLHTQLRLFFVGYPLQASLPNWLFHLLFRNGGNGVTAFFAISGFLITLTSIRRFGGLPALKPRVFYRIRFARIAPLLFVLVTVLSTLAYLHVAGFTFRRTNPPIWRAALSAFTFHLNWLEARYGYLPANWDVLWSLSIEEMFYLFFPVVCLLCFRLRQGRWLFLGTLLTLVAMGPFARTVWTTNPIWQEKTYLGGTDGIALGCLTALLTEALRRKHGGRWAAAHRGLLNTLQLAGAAFLTLSALGPRWFWRLLPNRVDYFDTIYALAVCFLLLGSVLQQRTGTAAWPAHLTAPLRWYGRHSYEVYLTHEFLVVFAVELFLRVHPNTTNAEVAPYQPPLAHTAGWIAAVLLLTAPLGWAVARFLSEPLNRTLRGARLPSETSARASAI